MDSSTSRPSCYTELVQEDDGFRVRVAMHNGPLQEGVIAREGPFAVGWASVIREHTSEVVPPSGLDKDEAIAYFLRRVRQNIVPLLEGGI